MSVVEIIPVATKRQIQEWVLLPERLYKDDPLWAAPLRFKEKQRIDLATNPFFQSGQAFLFLALKDSEVSGRISAHFDQRTEETRNKRTAFFGFFETVDDPEVAKALLDAAKAWARDQKATAIEGPYSFTINEEPGLQVDGFDIPSAMLMPRHKSYYEDHLKASGFETVQDLFAFRGKTEEFQPLLDRTNKLRLSSRNPVSIRPIDVTKLDSEAALMLSLVNRSLKHNWGFLPFTDAEAAAYAEEMRPIAKPDTVFFAYDGDEPIGLIAWIPDLWPTFSKLKGKLLPFGWLQLLLAMRRKKAKRVRVLLGGVVGELIGSRKSGFALACLQSTALQAIKERGAEEIEISWIVEGNPFMVPFMEGLLSMKASQTFRIFRASTGLEK